MTRPDAEDLNVSRETFLRLEAFVALLEKWNPKINLISKSTVPDIWLRHISDSLEVYDAGPPSFDNWVDLGSGAGLPGMVVAILAEDHASQGQVSLVESDQRKSAFLRAALRETGASGKIHASRIEDLPPLQADVLSARALADLTTLLGYAERHLSYGGIALFSKGVNWEKEVAAAKERWSFTCEPIHSRTEEGSVILRIGEISRV